MQGFALMIKSLMNTPTKKSVRFGERIFFMSFGVRLFHLSAVHSGTLTAVTKHFENFPKNARFSLAIYGKWCIILYEPKNNGGMSIC